MYKRGENPKRDLGLNRGPLGQAQVCDSDANGSIRHKFYSIWTENARAWIVKIEETQTVVKDMASGIPGGG